ncbi:NAD-dependent epimerase [Desulfitobacterium metallireducens DSM 15288]|uniref:UDP-glucose 4-epimerase n=2 Tax=Desulfitobacterium TaxID=36853 RepID=W0EFU0_9FIRM|nr:NAD-dependent epimerase [Desulfitobacterium metallireducens DSM 15288]
MRCLVLGGRGFIGSHLVDALLTKGYRVRCFDRRRVTQQGEFHITDQRFELFEGDFMNEADVANALEGCDICYHLISTTLPKSSNDDPVFDVESNLLGSVRLLTNAVKAGVRKVVFVSSGGTVYGVPTQVPIPETHMNNPVCSYGITKLAIEKYLDLFYKLHGLDYTVLRLANPFGEGQKTHASQGAVAVFLGKVLQGETIDIWGDGSVIRDYVYIDDVVRAFLAVLEYSGPEHIFNIGSGRGLSINEVLDSIERVTGRPVLRHYVSGRPFDVPSNILCISRAETELGWSPRFSFEDGILRFAKWLNY